MPLPFLTADSGHDEHPAPRHDAVALPDPDAAWRRPYRPGPWRVAAAAIALVIASYLLFAALITAAAGSLSGAGFAAGAGLALIAGTLRLLRAGLWVSGRGLRLVRLLRTTTLPWHEVREVRTAQQPVRLLGLPRTVQGQALVLTRTGAREPLTVLTDHNADFHGRVEAFDIAADAVEGWAAQLSGKA